MPFERARDQTVEQQHAALLLRGEALLSYFSSFVRVIIEAIYDLGKTRTRGVTFDSSTIGGREER